MSEKIPCRVPGCRKTFDSRVGEGSHQKSHRGEKRQCSECGRRFRDLEGHIKARHPETLEPEVGEELSFETWEHWQRLEELEAENTRLREEKAADLAEIARLEGLRKRYYDNWQKAKSKQ